MNNTNRVLALTALSLITTLAHAGDFVFRVVASGLSKPTGIAVSGVGNHKTLYFTQVPTPGVGGGSGGTNSVKSLNLRTMAQELISMGEPEPVNIAFSHGDLYWTCRTAGVILQRNRWGEIRPILTGLHRPTGLALDAFDQVYFTQVPTPGIGGGSGGTNTVDVFTNGSVFNLTRGEPEPTDVVVSNDGTAYWTCRSAGVVLQRTRFGVVSLVAGGLSKPTGIALNDRCDKLYWTEVPTPGISGSNGGMNVIKELNLDSSTITVVHAGDPEPTDIAVARDGSIYWTCTSAGVIVEARRH